MSRNMPWLGIEPGTPGSKFPTLIIRPWRNSSYKHTIYGIAGNMFNPFPHTTIQQQTPLNIFCWNIENLYNWMDNLWLKVENIVSKGEIARFEQFPFLSLCFQKAVCCRGVRKRLYEGKCLIFTIIKAPSSCYKYLENKCWIWRIYNFSQCFPLCQD